MSGRIGLENQKQERAGGERREFLTRLNERGGSADFGDLGQQASE